ncbi:aspartate/glutamate racemase family protein [Candidatus Purcelliella pentastirinorum]|uniref:Aspartate/glutamate racemase family protein n=1 Tax=Candidatus Purcelliella pentastirinorum TaxID=472834 RepID=A0AAX3N789_9ENTR|nr:aspartate/glutamate racemase family protein [Candidatus Purcelliella pentastirinorum]WDI78371.1 aspartate/glutamate racemase family protein [Candidatus Purcelliella pentastirinorum]WDR80602.1 aspartate/glutamate racemase family protein [Candidatus Purcelliella pentastirinorum]
MNKKIIKIINPNSSKKITKEIDTIAKNTANFNTKIITTRYVNGISSIENYYDEAICIPNILKEIKKESKNKEIKGYIIACFGDPGLLAARELTKYPVIGIAEAAMHITSLISTKFSILTTLPYCIPMIQKLINTYGFKNICCNIHSINLSVNKIKKHTKELIKKIEKKCQIIIKNDNCNSIILGCSAMSPLSNYLTKKLNIPIIEGISSAVKLIETLISLKLFIN